MNDFDIDHLNFDDAEERVLTMLEEEVNTAPEEPDDDDDCAGGACKI